MIANSEYQQPYHDDNHFYEYIDQCPPAMQPDEHNTGTRRSRRERRLPASLRDENRELYS